MIKNTKKSLSIKSGQAQVVQKANEFEKIQVNPTESYRQIYDLRMINGEAERDMKAWVIWLQAVLLRLIPLGAGHSRAPAETLARRRGFQMIGTYWKLASQNFKKRPMKTRKSK